MFNDKDSLFHSLEGVLYHSYGELFEVAMFDWDEESKRLFRMKWTLAYELDTEWCVTGFGLKGIV